MTDQTPQDPESIAAILKREYEQADSYAMQIDQLNRQAFEYYEAQPFGNEIPGRSSVVLPDVQETIDYMQQSVLRTFVSGDRTVEFEASDETDKQAADDATAGINYNFMRQQDGFRILHDALYDGLLKKLGVFKTGVETVEKVSRQRITATPEEISVIADEGGWEIEDGEEQPDGTFKATLKREKIEKRFVDYSVPVLEFRFSPGARHEDEADYLCHVTEKTRSDLVEMGFDADQVYSLPTYQQDWTTWRAESTTLDNLMTEQTTRPLEKVLLCEEYARIDIDGDGIAERVKVFRVESEILIDAETGEPSIETVDDQPFSVFCPFPRPHRMVGYSLADKVMHIQLQRSFVARQLFDGLALTNMPRLAVDTTYADETAYNDILSPIPGSPVRIKGGLASVQPIPNSFDPGKSLSVMEWITGERESLTGITRLNQGLDADALNKTATGTAMMQAQGQQNEEAIARQFAETVGRLFLKKYRLMRAEGDPFKVKVDSQYREIDPSTWPDDINIIVRVGLGSNSKDKRIQYRMSMGDALTQSVMQGLSGPEHVFNWFDGMARDTGLGQGDDFCYDPKQGGAPQKPEQPDPAVLKAQSDAQLAQQKQQFDQQSAAAKLQSERELGAAKLQTQQQMDAASIEAMREKAAAEQQLAREKAEFEAQLAMEQADREFALETRRMDHQHALAEQSAAREAELSKKRPGGDLDK